MNGTKEQTFPCLGLDLYISSEIIKRTASKIYVHSIERKGSDFCFEKPKINVIMPSTTQVLVLDDSPAIVDSIEIMMELEGLSVSKFYKGSDMLNALHPESKPDVILMDMWLSGEDGRDICRHIRADENLRNIPVVIMSASRGLEQSALDAGANDFIAKPFDMEDMISRVKAYIK